MKRFRFGLEKVLELRRYLEENAKNELGKAIGILTEIENNIKINYTKHTDAIEERFKSINTPNVTSGDDVIKGDDCFFSMQAWDNYILRLEREAVLLAEQAVQAELLVEEKRNLYLEASRELKVMEKLKEKRAQEHRKAMFAAETRELDDRRRTDNQLYQ